VPWIKTRLLFGSVISLLRRADRPPRPIRTACKFMQDPESQWQKVVSMYVRNVFGAIVHGDTRWGSSLMESYLPCACARGKDIKNERYGTEYHRRHLPHIVPVQLGASQPCRISALPPPQDVLESINSRRYHHQPALNPSISNGASQLSTEHQISLPLFFDPSRAWTPHSRMEDDTRLFSINRRRALTCSSGDTSCIPSKADESTMPMILRHGHSTLSLSTSQSSITENSECEPRKKSMWFSFARHPSRLTLVCIGVHVAVVLLHVFFLISWHLGWEQRITFAVGSSSDTASTVVTVALQSLATVSLAD
jgi:hypothetical protein